MNACEKGSLLQEALALVVAMQCQGRPGATSVGGRVAAFQIAWIPDFSWRAPPTVTHKFTMSVQFQDALAHWAGNTITNLAGGVNGMGDEGVERLAVALERNTSLTTLGLGMNGIGAEGAEGHRCARAAW